MSTQNLKYLPLFLYNPYCRKKLRLLSTNLLGSVDKVDIRNYYQKNGSIEEQVMELTSGKGVNKVIIAGGDVDTFLTAIKVLKPGGKIGKGNYIGEGDYIKIPRVEWGCGMGHKQISAGLMPGGRLRMEKLISLIETGRINPSRLVTHKFYGFDKVEEALLMMKDKPRDLIQPIVFIE